MKGDKGSLTWTLVFGIFAICKGSGCQEVSVSENILHDQIQRCTRRRSTFVLNQITSDCNNFDLHMCIDKTMVS